MTQTHRPAAKTSNMFHLSTRTATNAAPVIYEGALGVKSAGRLLSGSVAPRRGVGGAVR